MDPANLSLVIEPANCALVMVPVKLVVAKLPSKLVAVTTPTALIPPARTLIPVLAVINPTESILVTSSYVKVPPTETFPENVASPTNVETPVTFIC